MTRTGHHDNELSHNLRLMGVIHVVTAPGLLIVNRDSMVAATPELNSGTEEEHYKAVLTVMQGWAPACRVHWVARDDDTMTAEVLEKARP